MAGRRLKQYRTHQGLTQKDVAKRLGVHFSEVAHYESGRRVPSLASAVGIERITATWPLGPIRPWEWVDPAKGNRAA